MTVESYHFDFMAEAIREAEISISEGGLPIGAVLTRDKKIIARGYNRRVQEQNVILHGEMSCMRNDGLIPFHDTVMYTTLSPCSMCAGAIVLSRFRRVIFGATDPKAGAAGSLYNVLSDERLNHRPEVIAGVLAEESGRMLSDFFRARRT